MSYSLTDDPRGEWSKPQLVLMPKPMMDINAAPVIKPDGSLVGMWRDHHPGGKHSTPHLFTATNWTDPATYKYSSAALFSSKVVKGAIEDMFMYRDKRGGYHVSSTTTQSNRQNDSGSCRVSNRLVAHASMIVDRSGSTRICLGPSPSSRRSST
jgi:hypothetical protein